MLDWVNESLQRVKTDRETRKRNRTAVQNHGIDMFGRLADAANVAVKQFNEGDELKSLIFSQGPSHKFTVQARGKGARIDIELDLEGEGIRCSYSDSGYVPEWMFVLRANECGDLIPQLFDRRDHDLTTIREENIIQKLLQPVFDSVK